MTQPESGEKTAIALDRECGLRSSRDLFCLPPPRASGEPTAYLCGHSLGLPVRDVGERINEHLDAWGKMGVAGYFEGPTWCGYPERLSNRLAALVGALPGEVAVTNTLTANIHCMLATFYRPDRRRERVLHADPSFPSDRYALGSHLRMRGRDPREALLVVGPRPGEALLREEDVEASISRHADEIAVVFLEGVSYLTGQVLDMRRLTACAHAHDCAIGFDLAHGAGNVELRLHDWEVDFAVWCSYKYLNAGPGAVGALFVHERHAANVELPRLEGWWGTDPSVRFDMAMESSPAAEAAGWQISTPPLLSIVPLEASLDVFERFGMPAIRSKSLAMTRYLRDLLVPLEGDRLRITTPAEPGRSGAMLSLALDGAESIMRRIASEGIICDFRRPDIIRVAPAPLYNTYHELWSFACSLSRGLKA